MTKYLYLWIVVAALVSLLVGGFVGYAFMPEKIVLRDKVIMPQCPETKCVMPTCPVCQACPAPVVCPEPEKCTFERASKQAIEDKKKLLETLTMTFKTSWNCADWKEDKKITTLPTCYQGKKITKLTDSGDECVISFLAGQC